MLRFLVIALLLPLGALAQAPAKPAAKSPAAAEGTVARVNGVAIPGQYADAMLHQRLQQGVADSDQLRMAVREELINREVIAQEANRSGLTKRPDVKVDLDMARQGVIVQAYLREYVARNPVTDAEIQKEYDRAKEQTGTTEYKARHILVDNEDEAKRILAEIKKGAKFEDMAQKHSRDSNKDRGGDLDWNVPAVYDKAFADAMVKLEKGKMSEVPVRTRFGYHIIRVDDVRPVKFPPLEEVKPRIQQRLTQAKVEKVVNDLRAKAKVE